MAQPRHVHDGKAKPVFITTAEARAIFLALESGDLLMQRQHREAMQTMADCIECLLNGSTCIAIDDHHEEA